MSAGAAPVAVDIGHYRAAPGAYSARGVPEFDFNLALAGVIRASLTARGVPVLLIGEAGTPLSLLERTATAGAAGAQLFLSLHHDAVQPHYLRTWTWEGVERPYDDSHAGFSLFVSRKNPHLDASLACARALGLALREAGFQPSEYHAEAIPGENRPWADRAAGVHYHDDLVVLKTAVSPAVLLEAGVIVNRREEQALADPARQARMAAALLQGLAACGVAAGSFEVISQERR